MFLVPPEQGIKIIWDTQPDQDYRAPHGPDLAQAMGVTAIAARAAVARGSRGSKGSGSGSERFRGSSRSGDGEGSGVCQWWRRV